MWEKTIELSKKYDNINDAMEEIQEKVLLTWRELLILFEDKLKIVDPDPNERRYNGFKKEYVEEFIKNTLKIDAKTKKLIFMDIVNNIDLSKLNKQQLSDFLNWWYKRYFLTELVKYIDTYVKSNMSIFLYEAWAKYILREIFDELNINFDLTNLVSSKITKDDYVFAWNLIALKIKEYLLQENNISSLVLLQEAFDDFYNNHFSIFLKRVSNIVEIFSYHESLILEFKKTLWNYIKENYILVDDKLLSKVIDKLFEDVSHNMLYILLAMKLLDSLRKRDFVAKKYLSLLFSEQVIIIGTKRFKLPRLVLSDFNKEKDVLDELISFLDEISSLKENYEKKQQVYQVKINEMKDLYKKKEKLFQDKQQLEENLLKFKNQERTIKAEINKLEDELINKWFTGRILTAFNIDTKVVELKKMRKELLSKIESIKLKLIRIKTECDSIEYQIDDLW